MTQQPQHDELVQLAFDETRRAAASQPAVCIYLLEAFDLVCEVLQSSGLGDRTYGLLRQARLVVSGCAQTDLLSADVELVRTAYEKRFSATNV